MQKFYNKFDFRQRRIELKKSLILFLNDWVLAQKAGRDYELYRDIKTVLNDVMQEMK